MWLLELIQLRLKMLAGCQTPTSVIVSPALVIVLPGKVFFGWSNGIPSLDKKIVLRNHIVPLQTLQQYY
jgi:hypothetical protein